MCALPSKKEGGRYRLSKSLYIVTNNILTSVDFCPASATNIKKSFQPGPLFFNQENMNKLELTERGKELIGVDLIGKIDTAINTNSRRRGDDLTFFVLNDVFCDIRDRAKEVNVPFKSLMGVVLIYLEEKDNE